MELSFVLITFLCIINRSFVLSDTKLEDAKKRLQNEPEVTMLDVYPELNVTTSEAYYGCYSPYYNKQLIKPLERKVIDIANDFLKVTPLKTNNELNRTKVFLDNLAQMTDFIFECTKKVKEDRMQFGLTSMAFYTDDEYLSFQNKKMASILKEKNTRRYFQCDVKDEYDSKVEEELDWKKWGIISAPLDQRNCSSDYVFAALTALESQYMHKKKDEMKEAFSEQMVVDCFKHNCEGGHPAQVWEYIKYYGITYLSRLPYNASKGQCLEYPKDGHIDNYCLYIGDKPFSDTLMTNLVYTYGPSIAGINTMDLRFKYVKNHYNGPCDQDLTHAVLVVGYTHDTWILKNSWGTNWGDDGFFTIPRRMNKCGINSVTGVPFI